MKIFQSFLVFILFFINLNAQNKDSADTRTPASLSKGRDTVQVRDSLKQSPDSLRDSTKVRKPETIIPIFKQQLYSPSEYKNLINRNEILYNVYRYAGDFFRYFPLAFERSLGVRGQPNEILVYGAGFNQVSYLRNGSLINNRLFNSFDLNNIQSEIIDSIEIIPSTRGFLYGNYNNNAAVNFVTKYKFVPDTTRGPYSRVRFYQAPSEEAVIDFMYSSRFSKRLSVTLDITNRTSNLRFVPTTTSSNVDAYGSWQGTARFRYFLSNKFNLIGSYKYLKSDTRLFGGTNSDSTPIRYLSRYQKITGKEFNIDLVGSTIENIQSEYSFYYSFNQTEFRNYEDVQETIPLIFDNNKYNLYGLLTRHSYENNVFRLNASAGYEIVDYKADVIKQADKLKSLFVSGRLTLNLPEKFFIPSFFAKYLLYNQSNLLGLGADITMDLFPGVQLYAGLSHYNRPLSILENYYIGKYSIGHLSDMDLKRTTSIEVGSKYKNEFLFTDLSLFYRQTNNDILPLISTDTLVSLRYIDSKIYGAGLQFNLNFWKFSLETNSAYYLSKQNGITNYRLPQFSFNGGIYYKNILFDSNLDLKTGIRGRFTGKQDYITYDFERNMTGPDVVQSPVQGLLFDQLNGINHSFNVDLVLIGEIRKAAILYFMYENVFGNAYYIVPFYPMYNRGIILGISWEFLN